MIANARMYAVTPEAEACWRDVLDAAARAAGVALDYEPYPAPQPLDTLWSRHDLGLVFMCGLPFAKTFTEVRPVAAPIPLRFGAPVYASDFVVRADRPFRTLADTFGSRIGWTVDHSQSGFNAPRHHLMRFASADRPRLYGASVGGLVTARRVVEAVLSGEVDVGPLDAYWHELLKRFDPEAAANLRVLETTEPTPAPLLVASAAADPEAARRLGAALAAMAPEGPQGALLAELRLSGFATISRNAYRRQLAQAAEAEDAGYREPG